MSTTLGDRVGAALVVLTSAAILVLEVIANRLVAPYVGLTLETYTASIGVALGAIAAGAALGGRLADVVSPRVWLGPATALGGGLLLLARPVVVLVGPEVGPGPFSTVLLVTLAVAPAVLVLASVTPGVVRLRLRRLEETGQTVGRLSALGTLGALAGTFLTGFVLLSSLPVSRVLLVTGAVLVVVGLVLSVGSKASLPLLGVATVAASLLVVVQGPCDVETRYYCARIDADPLRPGGRTLVLDGLRHSYVDLDDPSYLEFSYTRRIGDVLGSRPAGPLRALHIGGGGFTVPRHLAAVRPGSQSRVLEVDPGVVEVGRDRLGLVTGPDLDVVVGDARTSLRAEASSSYDVVVGDAFGGLAVPWHLTTRELVEDVRRVLDDDGLYVLNVIDRPPLRLARAEAATLRAVFAEVVLLGTQELADGEVGGNVVLLASDAPIDRARLQQLADARAVGDGVHDTDAFAAGARVLTDDDAPVDQLLTPYADRA